MKKLNIALIIALCASTSVQMFGMTYEQYMIEKEYEQQKRKMDELQQKLKYYKDPSYVREREGTRGPVSIMEHPGSRSYINMQDRLNPITGEYTKEELRKFDYEDVPTSK
jgi:hypothetical protein